MEKLTEEESSSALSRCPVDMDHNIQYYEDLLKVNDTDYDALFQRVPRGFQVFEDYRLYGVKSVSEQRRVPDFSVAPLNNIGGGLGEYVVRSYCIVIDVEDRKWAVLKDYFGNLSYVFLDDLYVREHR